VGRERGPDPGAEVPATQAVTGLDGEQLALGAADGRRVMTYLVVRESDDYIAIMDVLESSVSDLTPDATPAGRQVHRFYRAVLADTGHVIEH
jgi:hypothetical protein